jgi:hypothetical protein
VARAPISRLKETAADRSASNVVRGRHRRDHRHGIPGVRGDGSPPDSRQHDRLSGHDEEAQNRAKIKLESRTAVADRYGRVRAQRIGACPAHRIAAALRLRFERCSRTSDSRRCDGGSGNCIPDGRVVRNSRKTSRRGTLANLIGTARTRERQCPSDHRRNRARDATAGAISELRRSTVHPPRYRSHKRIENRRYALRRRVERESRTALVGTVASGSDGGVQRVVTDELPSLPP